jgi:hypothetical protein
MFSTRLNFGLQMIHTYQFLINPFPTQPNGLQPKIFNRVKIGRLQPKYYFWVANRLGWLKVD